MSINKVILLGNVGRDPEVRYVDKNVAVATFTLATTDRAYTLPNGTQVPERTEWHNIVAWEGRGMPDFALIKKGAFIYACGRLRVSKFTNSEGEEKRVYEIVANRLQLVKPEDFA